MKISSLTLLLTLALAPFTRADERSVADSLANSPAWLNRGPLSMTELDLALGVSLSPSQRERVARALAERNAALERANANFRATLAAELKQDDAQITARVERGRDAREDAAKLERVRRAQPSRYQAVKRQQKREAAERAAAERTAKPK